MKRYAKRKSHKVQIFFSLLVFILLCIIAGKLILNSDFTAFSLNSVTRHAATEDYGWNLILINRDNYIPGDYEWCLQNYQTGKSRFQNLSRIAGNV